MCCVPTPRRGVRGSPFLPDFALPPDAANRSTLVVNHYPGIDLAHLDSALTIS